MMYNAYVLVAVLVVVVVTESCVVTQRNETWFMAF